MKQPPPGGAEAVSSLWAILGLNQYAPFRSFLGLTCKNRALTCTDEEQ